MGEGKSGNGLTPPFGNGKGGTASGPNGGGGHDFVTDPESADSKKGGRDFTTETRKQPVAKSADDKGQNAESIPAGGDMPWPATDHKRTGGGVEGTASTPFKNLK